MPKTKKVIWPIDPKGSHKDMDHAMFDFFKSFSQVVDLEVQPVYVLSSTFFVTSEYFEAIEVHDLQKNMYEECQGYLQYFKDYVKKEPLVLNHNYSAAGAEVSLFGDFVKDYQPDFVVMASHGRTGWSRGFMGSFTESFLLVSEAPVIVVGKDCRKVTDMKKAFMPVELNESSQKFLEAFLDDHRLAFLEKLTLFHKISMVDLEDISWAPTLYGLSDFSSHDIVNKARESTREYLESFLEHPLSQKRLDYQISEKLDPVASIVNEEVEAGGYGTIVMRSESGPLSANFLGSVTREVIRTAIVPVIVYPHSFKPE